MGPFVRGQSWNLNTNSPCDLTQNSNQLPKDSPLHPIVQPRRWLCLLQCDVSSTSFTRDLSNLYRSDKHHTHLHFQFRPTNDIKAATQPAEDIRFVVYRNLIEFDHRPYADLLLLLLAFCKSSEWVGSAHRASSSPRPDDLFSPHRTILTANRQPPRRLPARPQD